MLHWKLVALAVSTQWERRAGDREGRKFSMVLTSVPFGVWVHEGIWTYEFISSAVCVFKVIFLFPLFLTPQQNSISWVLALIKQYNDYSWAFLFLRTKKTSSWPSFSRKVSFHRVTGTWQWRIGRQGGSSNECKRKGGWQGADVVWKRLAQHEPACMRKVGRREVWALRKYLWEPVYIPCFLGSDRTVWVTASMDLQILWVGAQDSHDGLAALDGPKYHHPADT